MTQWQRALRRRLTGWGITQAQMADLAGVSPQRINDWVKGHREPSDAIKATLIDRLHIDPAEVAPEWLRPAATQPLPASPLATDRIPA